MTNGIASPVEIYVEISRGGRERRIRGMDSCDTIRHPESPSPEDEQTLVTILRVHDTSLRQGLKTPAR